MNCSFLAEIIRADPRAAHDQTVLGNLIYILQTSWRDVAVLLLWTLKMLSDHPEWATRVREELGLSGKERMIRNRIVWQAESLWKRCDLSRASIS